MTTHDLARRDTGGDLATDTLFPRFVVDLDVLKEQVARLDQFKRDVMVSGTDYAVIPGTPKPSLLKPGAEKLCQIFGLRPHFLTLSRIEDWEAGHFHYEVECQLINKRTSEVVCNGIGSANTREPRYRYRNAQPTCPDCGKELRRSKQGDGWYCWTKMGGCGRNLDKGEVGPVGRVENPEPYELVNTVLKMAQKRSLIAATLVATATSGAFTQDLEDMPHTTGQVIEGEAREVRKPPATRPTQPARPRAYEDVFEPEGTGRVRRAGVPVHDDQQDDDRAAGYDRLVAANFPDEAGSRAPAPHPAAPPSDGEVGESPPAAVAPATPTRREKLWDRYQQLLATVPEKKRSEWKANVEWSDDQLEEHGKQLRAFLKVQGATP